MTAVRYAIAGAVASLAVAFVSASGAARATTIAPVPCTGALALYTRVGTLSNVDGSHRRSADVEARLAILRDGRAAGTGGRRVGWAYVDGEGDIWVAFDAGERSAASDWRHVAPGHPMRAPAYALIERVGIPHGYRFTACAP